jgi:hypothetical protein
MYLIDTLQIVDAMDYRDAICVIDRARARVKEIIDAEPNLYLIKKTYRGDVRYMTDVMGQGEVQFLATNLNHSSLRRIRGSAKADFICKFLSESELHNNGQAYEVVPVAKAEGK